MKGQAHIPAYRMQPDESQTRDRRQLVLVIEDDDALRRLLEMALHYQGYSVVTTATVQEAEAALQQWGDVGLDFVISDINLTRGSLDQEGYMLYLRWSERCPSLPYMLISADSNNHALPAIQEGKVYFMEKPFEITELLGCIQEVLTYAPVAS